MNRNTDALNRSADWSAWDANTKCCRRSARFRKALRMIIKHQQRDSIKKEMFAQQREEEDFNG